MVNKPYKSLRDSVSPNGYLNKNQHLFINLVTLLFTILLSSIVLIQLFTNWIKDATLISIPIIYNGGEIVGLNNNYDPMFSIVDSFVDIWSLTTSVCNVYKNNNVSYALINPRVANMTTLLCTQSQNMTVQFMNETSNGYIFIQLTIISCVIMIISSLTWLGIKYVYSNREKIIIYMFAFIIYITFIIQKVSCLVALILYLEWLDNQHNYVGYNPPNYLTQWTFMSTVSLMIITTFDLIVNGFRLHYFFRV